MNGISEEEQNLEDLTSIGSEIQTLLKISREPLIILNNNHRVLAANQAFLALFKLNSNIRGLSVKDPNFIISNPELDFVLDVVLPEKKELQEYPISYAIERGNQLSCTLNATIDYKDPDAEMIYLSFRKTTPSVSLISSGDQNYRNIVTHVPAMICILKGPEHIYEIANKKYLNFIDRRNIIGKSAKEVLPELEDQGFVKILDNVYASGESHFGKEVIYEAVSTEGKASKAYFDFLFQPTRDPNGKVDGIFVHAIDVSEAVIARKKLEDGKDRLKTLVESIPAIVWLSNKDSQTEHLNKNWYKYSGQTQSEAVKWGWLDAVYPEHREMVVEACKEAHGSHTGFSVNHKLYRQRDHEYRWVLNTGESRFDAEGNFEGMIGTIIDMHEEKLKEEQLKEKEHRIRSLVEEATVATAMYIGDDMQIELANDAMISLWGKDRSVIGKTLKEAVPELEGQPFLGLLQKVYTTGEIYWGKEDKVDLMIGGRLQTGYFNFTYKPLRNEQGQIYGILNMAVNVSDMIESRRLLKESEFHFRQMADLMPEKMANTTPDGKLIYFNQNWLDYTGMSSEELQESTWTQFIHPDERKDFEGSWRYSLDTGNDFEMELRFLDRFGKYKWHLSRAEAVRDDNGNIKMWITNNTEIQKLKEEEKRKEDFLKMVSHELKTPVTSIKGYVQLLLRLVQQKSGKVELSKLPLETSLERIDHQINRLTRLIAEMLDITRIEENKLVLVKTSFNLNELVDETIQDIHFTNTRHNVKVQHQVVGSIHADRDRIGQVLINLITNAIKYSPERQDVEVEVFEPGEGLISVVVRDSGIGIEPKKHKSIFKRFFRAGGKSEETYAGFGIGLYLANEIIQRHQGSIDVKSEIGKGSEFIITLSTDKK